MSSACSFIFMQIKAIFIRMVSHLDSLWNGGTRELGNDLFPLYYLSSGRLRKVKNKGQFWTLSSKSGRRGRLLEVVSYKRFQTQWFDWETFGLFGKLVAEERLSLRRGCRWGGVGGRWGAVVAEERRSLRRRGRWGGVVAEEGWSLRRGGRLREVIAYKRFHCNRCM